MVVVQDLRFIPRYIRLPKKGQCPHSGLTRSVLNRLILKNKGNGWKPPVKSKTLALEPGKRGVKLILYDSLMAYLDRLPDEGDGPPLGGPELTT